MIGDADGCRPADLFGVWGIDPGRFKPMVEIARGADLAALRAEAKAEAGRGRRLYSTMEGVATIELSGPLTKYETSFQALFGGTSTIRSRQALRAAARDPEVAGIMVMVDSPGGTHAGTQELAEDVRQAAARKPLDVYIEDMAASAALWAASGARRIWANAGALVGSIGTFTVVEDTSGLYSQKGIKVHVVSSAPPIKGAGVDGSEVTAEQLAEWKRLVDSIAGVFVSEVAQGRGMPRWKAEALHTGELWIAEEARRLGLIDGVMSLDQAREQLQGNVPAAKAARVEEGEMVRSKFEVYSEIRRKAQEAFPALTKEQAVAQFCRQPAGAALYAEYQRAPGPNEAPSPAKRAAGDKAQVYEVIKADARLAHPRLTPEIAVLRFLRANPQRYDEYAGAPPDGDEAA